MPNTNGGKVTPIPSGLIASMRGAAYNIIGAAQAWFGPGQPIAPIAPQTEEAQVKGRQLDYPYGYNLPMSPRAGEPLGFADLRSLADALPLLRAAIETRKDQIQNVEWNIRPRDKKKRNKGSADKRVEEVTNFLQYPDKEHDFTTWMRMLIEEMLVTDAATIYPRLTYGGGLYSLDLMDGALIKRLVDGEGRTPTPPDPAYQQFLHGIPAADYTTEELIYAPRNVRVSRFYGFSPVEQLILTVEIALKRELYNLAYYTEGTVPDAIAALPKDWTSAQAKEFQDYWDSLLSGALAERRKVRFVPGGGDFKFETLKAPPLKDQYDEFLARLICYSLSVSVSPLVSQVNRATGETIRLQATEEGLSPTLKWTGSIMNRILWGCFGYADLEFAWEDPAAEDPLKMAQSNDLNVKNGTSTIDQLREARGEEAYGISGVTDVPLVFTPSGPVPLEEAVETAREKLLNPPEPPPMLGGPKNDHPSGNSPADHVPPGGKPPVADKEVGKVAGIPFEAASQSARGLHKAAKYRGFKYERPLTRITTRKLKTTVENTLAKLGESVVSQVRKSLRKAKETNEQRAQRIVDELDLSALEAMVNPTEADLLAVAKDSAARTLALFGDDTYSSLVDQVNTEAADWAKFRAAELIGMKYNDKGDLVPSDNAEYAIDETTRNMVRETIYNGLEENIGIDEIAADLEENFAFSPERAELIANTEVRRANNESSLLSAKAAAEETGLNLRKVWLTADDEDVDEEICIPNEEQGPIELDDVFDSGDEAPPGHPRCRCTLSYEVKEQDDEED